MRAKCLDNSRGMPPGGGVDQVVAGIEEPVRGIVAVLGTPEYGECQAPAEAFVKLASGGKTALGERLRERRRRRPARTQTLIDG